MLFSKLSRALRRKRRTEAPEPDYDRLERDRLTAEYAGSYMQNKGQEYGIIPPK